VSRPRSAGGLSGVLARAAACATLALLVQGCGTRAEIAAAPLAADGANPAVLIMISSEVSARFAPGSAGMADYGVAAPARGVRRTAASVAKDHGLELVSDWPMPALGMHCFLMHPRGSLPLDAVLAGLDGDRRIEWAQASQHYRILGHTDPYYPLQAAARELRLDEVHALSTGRGVSVAEIDTGIDLHHPDLAGQVAEFQNFVDGGRYEPEVHGTAVAGIIAGRADNGIGIVGIAPAASLLGLRACRETGARHEAACDTFSLAKALQFALRREAGVVNLSLTGPYDRLLAALLDKAFARDTVVIAAADPDRADGGFPASYRGVIAVAAEGSPSRAQHVAVLAPGVDVLTTVPPAGWDFLSGASMAAAHVSGVAALLLARRPGMSPAQVAQAIMGGGGVGAEAARPLDARAALAAAVR
jgi:subtilisin family serine protease